MQGEVGCAGGVREVDFVDIQAQWDARDARDARQFNCFVAWSVFLVGMIGHAHKVL